MSTHTSSCPSAFTLSTHDENGRPQFSFLRYVENVASGATEAERDEGEGGGILHALVALSVTDDQRREAERELRRITRLLGVIDASLFMITGTLDYDRIVEAVTRLANAVHEYSGDSDDIWYIGEHGSACIADFIPGAYWHFTEWHAGQSSPSYAALSALGTVFSPGMSCSEPDDITYTSLQTMAEQGVAS